ncbi:MAG: YkgJ family cysteine cluster protein [Proteobacteria bacterium]|nr:YkgJ family cysteine cluster protein [Pseudomonadota bacterium]MBU1737058.1 YkgJ family cysteine cluster protein [Pseudomonadota bacterium]
MNRQNGFSYQFDNSACKTCGGRCCRGRQGYVWISVAELQAMAAARKMAVEIFTRQFVREFRGRLSLQERVVNGEHFCCFFDPIDCRCTVYEARPEQCRLFPFWKLSADETREMLAECPGVSLKDEGG